MQPNEFDMPVGLDGNLYPRDGAEYFDEPQERQEIEREEQNEMASTIPFLNTIHAWFSDEIASADSIDNIRLSSVEIGGVKYTGEIAVQAQVLAFQLLKQKLEEKRDSFPSLEEIT